MKKDKKTPKTYRKRTTTSRQQEAKKNIIDNHCQKKALKDAGYSDSYAHNPGEFAKTKAGQDLVEIVNRIRDKSLKRAEDLAGEASYKDSVRGADTLNKIGRLEQGESTDIVETKIKGLTDSLKKIAEGK